MTLIATIWSPEGFAIAADGLELTASSEGCVGDVQKIFDTLFANDTGFAWAWVGHVGVEFASGRRYNLKEITQRVMGDLPDDAYLDDSESYFDRIDIPDIDELQPLDSIPSSLPDGDDDVIFVGYCWKTIADRDYFPAQGRDVFTVCRLRAKNRATRVSRVPGLPLYANE